MKLGLSLKLKMRHILHLVEHSGDGHDFGVRKLMPEKRRRIKQQQSRASW
jgi:hypothetical protein